MKKIFAAFVLGIFTMGSAVASSADSIQVRIKGMRCEECAHKIYDRLTNLKGVEDVTFNLERRTATIFYDANVTNADSVQKPLLGTRYKPTPYSPTEVIRRGKGFKLLGMTTNADATKAANAINGIQGVDSVATDAANEKIFVRYDANKTEEAVLRSALKKVGFAPVTFYTSGRIDYALLPVPAGKATPEMAENLLAIDAIDDTNFTNDGRFVAITYDKKLSTKEDLAKEVQKILAQ